MPGMWTAKVSQHGQVSLPTDLRRRWRIEGGGAVGIIDLGDAALIVPDVIQAARRELRRVLSDRYEAGLDGVDDPDLADQKERSRRTAQRACSCPPGCSSTHDVLRARKNRA